MHAPIRVLLVEDNDVFREALEFLLKRREDVAVAGAIANGSSAATACADVGADVVVIDYRLPDVDGSVVVSEVRERCPGVGVVFLSASAGPEEREAARIFGVQLVRKDEGVEALVGAVRGAVRRKGLGMDLTTENTAIVLDSTSDYPEAPSRFPNMRVVPLYVRFGDDTYRDYVELGPVEFFEKLRTLPELPATSQPTPQDFNAAYESLAGYEHIYSLHVSSKVSGTLQSAALAAQELGGDRIRVVDTRSVSLAIAMLAHAMQRRLARGTTDVEIEALVERFHRDCGVVFTVETLEYLQRGGRIGRAAALAGSLLNVRPILAIQDGEVVAVARVRGRPKALAEFERRFAAATEDRAGLRVAIAHADAPEWVGTLSELVWRVRPKAEIEFTATLGAVVSTHAGPGTVGFFWFMDN